MGAPRRRAARAGPLVRLLQAASLAAHAAPRAGVAAAKHHCDGYDEEWGACESPTPCPTCTPVDCAFAPWSDWYAGGGCTGLVFRQRTVKVTNNECGQPCEGPMVDSERRISGPCVLEPQDCRFSDWGLWSECTSPTDQSYRTRKIATPPLHDGKPCMGKTQETQPCNVGPPSLPCEFSTWQSWTECSASCGTGRHQRTRQIRKEAKRNGEACRGTTMEAQTCMVQPCASQDCRVSDWSAWSMCDSEHNTQRYRMRRIEAAQKRDGKPCPRVLKETLGCIAPPKEDCVLAEWGNWGVCDKTCDGGQTCRTRFLLEPMSDGGACPKSALRETKPCNIEPCIQPPGNCEMAAWGEWSACSAKCGKGSRTRKRQVAEIAEKGGQGCMAPLEEMGPCEAVSCAVTDCAWSDWYDWSVCSSSCGGGVKKRNRVVASAPRNGGDLCEPLVKSEAVPCNTEPCSDPCVDAKWGEWKDWSECSSSCSSGFKLRRREIARDPNSCGKPASGLREEYRACSELPPCVTDTNCSLSDWGEWSFCSCTCFGIRERNRVVKVFASGKGLPCRDDSLKEIAPCNPGLDEEVKPSCTEPKQDCSLSDWSEWSACTNECGGGQKEKQRRVLREPKNGGAPCSASLTIMAPCNTEPCKPITPCVDCQWNPWGDWGECSECGGQRSRHRSIERMPNYCGKLCDLVAAKEVSNCTSRCGGTSFCAWTEWSEPNSCDAGCGIGTTTRNRVLGFTKTSDDYLFADKIGSTCSGTQMAIIKCPNSKLCKDECVPRDGEFGAWGEWNAPTCTGLCERRRVIETMNNECGAPVEGPLLETKPCKVTCNPSLPCILSDWEDWSPCRDPDGQRFRGRGIKQMPVLQGKPCEGVLNETTSCSPPCLETSCAVTSWGEWGQCTRSCSGGWQTRQRRIMEHARCGGSLCEDHLEELQMCNKQPCFAPHEDCTLTDWGSWSGCGVDRQRYRERKVGQLADGGRPCAGHLEETETCEVEVVDCDVSAWSEWDACEKTCGGGQQHRHRQIHAFPRHGGKACPMELVQTRGCNAEACSANDCELSTWAEWERCSTTCGGGQQSRFRAVLHNRRPGGLGCRAALSETRFCPENYPCPETDCEWHQWSEWGTCTSSCDGGQMTRSRQMKTTPRGGGAPCDPKDQEEVAACNTQSCVEQECENGEWGDWDNWSPCSRSCGGGVRFRTREVAKMADECGAPASGRDRDIEFCNVDIPCDPALDCEFTEWGTWSDCSTSCNGIKKRSRRIGRYGRGSGAYCVGGLKETRPCNPSPGEAAPGGCGEDPPVDCKVSHWAEWNDCTASCEGGQRVRHRELIQMPRRGGKLCDGPLSAVEECSRVPCPGDSAVDCKLGEWYDWGTCSKCGGQRKRFRSIDQYPAHGGRNCQEFIDEEMGSCPRSCNEKTFCTWSDWRAWGPCSARCGQGKRSRRRYLNLSDMPSAPPKPVTLNDTLMVKYTELHQRRRHLQKDQMRQLLLAFGGGCFCFVLAFAGVRVFSMVRSHQPHPDTRSAFRGEPTYRPLSEEWPLVGGSTSDNE